MEHVEAKTNKESESKIRELDLFYEEYKKKLNEIVQEEKIKRFKDATRKLSEIEIILARFENKEKSSDEYLKNYEAYIDKGRMLLEESEANMNEENTRNLISLKYNLSLRISFICRKLKNYEDEKFFTEYYRKLEYNKIQDIEKERKRKELDKDLSLENFFKEYRSPGISLFTRIIYFVGSSIFIVGTILGIYYIIRRKKPGFFKYFTRNKITTQ